MARLRSNLVRLAWTIAPLFVIVIGEGRRWV
jgi:hypothetical protein